MSGASECLTGYRVVELAQYLPGPLAGQILSDLGADVVKIEPPGGDPLRRMGPLDPDGISAFYKLLNAGKTVVRLDLKAEAERMQAVGLITRCDVLLESYRPGALAKHGLGREALAKHNPHLIHCALTGYGHSGPYAERSGHDLNYMALAGAVDASGLPDRPIMTLPPTADYASAQQAALGIVAALLRRERNGQGAFIDVSMSETVLAWQSLGLTEALRGGAAPRGLGLLSGGAACYQIYRTADRRFITLGAIEEKFWTNFCRALKRPDWIDRQSEPLPQDGLIAEVAQAIRAEPLAHWQGLLDEVDCCFQPVLVPQEVADSEHFAARGVLHRDKTGPSLSVGFAALFDDVPSAQRGPLREVTLDALERDWPDRGERDPS